MKKLHVPERNALKTSAGEGVYRFISMNERTSRRWPSRAAANAKRPLVKQEPLPAPNEESATDIGIIIDAKPRILFPQV